MKNNISFLYGCISLYIMMLMMIPFYGSAQERVRPRFEIETDPLAFLLQGYSAHAAVTYSGFRSSIGVYGIKSPDFLKSNDAFYVYTSGFDFKTDYLFGSVKGFYAGVQFTYSKDRIGLRDAAYREDLWGLNIGLRGGYRFMFGKPENQYRGFYITPWVALLYNPSANTVWHGSEEYEQASWVPFPTLHLGWRF
ncbi:hypothetical protein H8S90_14950 [Olivibacter sp. SDN3]|uniref:hypothetical protein n=1 Tax=Olivibacter sp. SDN3 TaxID=2764720 RepID=UPI0016513E2F|nr:hypothetical protein [Olivibacter sp. SDN3]QNL48104.1 hypothetical protein H8S90_14950 [Olivibacter sp. SDN3]